MSSAYWVDWLALLVRWLHLISGIAWIGASFYFVWLDNHLRRSARERDRERGVHGEVWSVHGGGFYHNQKFLLGPQGEPLSDQLHWFKWEAYWTWISGMLLLSIVYWHGASVFLIDAGVADLSVPVAVGLSAGALIVGWIVYDLLCRFIPHDGALGMSVAAFFVAADWGLFQLFGARAAYLHVGAMIGTCMVANVFFVIIPGQRRIVDAIRAGRAPDPRPGVDAKRRSVHNTYFTLPVLFIMISNHYPMTYSHELGWLVLLAVSAAGVLIRQFFLLRHKGRHNLLWPAAAGAILVVVALGLAPRAPTSAGGDAVSFARVRSVLETHCNTCHSAEPSSDLFQAAPLGATFDTPAQIRTMMAQIYQRTVVTRDMPLANTTEMTDAERELIARWYFQETQARDP